MALQSRLSTALTTGQMSLPKGPVTVMRPPQGYDLSGISGDLTVVTTSFPDHEAYRAAGYAVATTPPDSAAEIIVMPRSKALARAMIADAARRAERIIVDGARTDGVDGLWREVRRLLGADVPSVTKDHGRIFWTDRSEVFASWAAPAEPVPGPAGFVTVAGVFSDGAVDTGSALLAEALPAKLPERMADLGAGWGYLSSAVLQRAGVASVDLIEAEALALDCARINVADRRAVFHWADATSFMPARAFDGIVMNPPFHTGRTGTPALGRAFVEAAARMLTPQGQLWMVANRHLPYEATLSAAFRTVEEMPGTGAFKLFHARGPQRARR